MREYATPPTAVDVPPQPRTSTTTWCATPPSTPDRVAFSPEAGRASGPDVTAAEFLAEVRVGGHAGWSPPASSPATASR